VLKSDPADAATMIELSGLAERSGDLNSAIVWLERAYKTDSRIPVVSALGDFYLRAGRGADALVLVTSFDQGGRPGKRLLEAEARSRIAIGDIDSAIRVYREVSSAEKGTASELNRIARVQRRLGDTRGAIFTFKMATALDSENFEVRDGALELEVPSGGTDRRLINAERLQRRYPSSGIGHVVAGNAWMRDKRFGRAANAFAAALEIEPRRDTVLNRSKALEHAGDRNAALRLLVNWIVDQPGDHVVRRELAFASINTGRLKRAKLKFEILIGASPKDAVALNNLAWLSTRLGGGEGQSFAGRAYALRPSDPAILDTYGMILVEQGEPERGLALLRRAQHQLAGDPRLGYHAAVALNRLGRDAEARAELETALNSDQGFAEAREARQLMRNLGGA
jgi:putative PEP-CTERM system TPR-repeat lipoprotein